MKRSIPFLFFLITKFSCLAAGHEIYFLENDSISRSAADIDCKINTISDNNTETISITLHNRRHTPFQPQKVSLKLGIDTYMDKYPDWNDKFFPTLMICEPTHCYGYLQSPSGKIKAIASQDPVASWSLDYNLGYQEPAPHWFYGHRIKALNLDLMSELPLPDHHPQNLWQLKAGEKKTWTVNIIDLDSLDNFSRVIHNTADVPTIELDRTSTAPCRPVNIIVYGKNPVLRINSNSLNIVSVGKDKWAASYASEHPGIYSILLTDGDKITHGHLNVRFPWGKVLKTARAAALRYHQKATSHVESWYGYHSAFLAARHFPDLSVDTILNDRFDSLLNNLFDKSSGKPIKYEWRIQNAASTVGMLADRYEAFHNINDLEMAEKIADWFIAYSQNDSGAFMNGNTDYSSVIYPAKSLLELADAERYAGRKSKATRYENSAKRAIDHLVSMNGDFNTEGEITYEDGMVSCAALQIGSLALRCKDKESRDKYTNAMLTLLKEHECLTQSIIIDGRRRGGTMRFWEAQYDVHMQPNMISSPHGWSAWRGYAVYYAYLLTGEERWLKEMFDAAASFASLIDFETGELRWAFVVDPHIKVKQISSADPNFSADIPSYGCPHPDMHPNREFIIGEQYVPMIADWQTIVSSDNDVHEVFKFIEESVLSNAFIVERPDGSFGCYNCQIEKNGKKLKIISDEKQIRKLHVNAFSRLDIDFDGDITYFR